MVRMCSPPPTFKSDIRKISLFWKNYAYITINTYNILTCAYTQHASTCGQRRNDRRMVQLALNFVIDRLRSFPHSTYQHFYATQKKFDMGRPIIEVRVVDYNKSLRFRCISSQVHITYIS